MPLPRIGLGALVRLMGTKTTLAGDVIVSKLCRCIFRLWTCGELKNLYDVCSMFVHHCLWDEMNWWRACWPLILKFFFTMNEMSPPSKSWQWDDRCKLNNLKDGKKNSSTTTPPLSLMIFLFFWWVGLSNVCLERFIITGSERLLLPHFCFSLQKVSSSTWPCFLIPTISFILLAA